MNPLTGGSLRRRSLLGRLKTFVAVVLALGAAGVVTVVGLDAGRDLGSRFDESTVATAGLPPQPPVAAPERRAALAPGIELDAKNSVRVKLDKPPRAAVLFDVENGDALWARRPREIVPIASLAKIMTALIVTERTSSRERAKVTRAALRYSGSGVGVLPRGRRVPVDALLNGLMLVSGNDAAIALADHVAGSERAFVRLMNERADELGLRCTHFSSAYGLEARDRSCAADLAALSRLAIEKSRIARVVRRRQVAVPFPLPGGKLYLNSTNPLLRLHYPGTIGLKTGYTQRAGRTYVGVVRRRGRTLGLVLLDSPDTGAQAKQVFDRAFQPPKRESAKAKDRVRGRGTDGRERRGERGGGGTGERREDRGSRGTNEGRRG